MNKKRYSLIVLATYLGGLIVVVGLTIFTDPYFHYHKPNNHMTYIVTHEQERYKNDGIMRYWDYDAMITGTSMTENFKVSELNKLFSKKAIKVPFEGASYKEINDNIKRALEYNSNLSLVVRSIDGSYYFSTADAMRHDWYPDYLTNENIFDDVYYVLNKDVFFEQVCPLLRSYSEEGYFPNFDDLYSWYKNNTFSKDNVLMGYKRQEKSSEQNIPTEEERREFSKNIEANLVSTVRDNPSVDFYYFLPPYSIAYWDYLNQTGDLQRELLGERMVIEALVSYENLHLFSFNNNYEIITNLNNYKDIAHYSQEINSYILECMYNEKYRLTTENYEEYLQDIEQFYSNYDYEVLFE